MRGYPISSSRVVLSSSYVLSRNRICRSHAVDSLPGPDRPLSCPPPLLARKSQYVRQYVWVGDRGRSEGNFLRYSCNRVREANLNASLEGRLRTITRVYLRWATGEDQHKRAQREERNRLQFLQLTRAEADIISSAGHLCLTC